MDWQIVIQAVIAVLLAYALFLLGLALYARRHPDVISLTDALRFGPDLLRLIRRLAADRALPRLNRIMLGGLVIYLILPIDLVPDFLPVIGYADDVVMIAVVLRAVVRRTGPDALQRHWPGSDGGLRAVRALAGLGGS
ncbi:MAG: hypothetical protein JWM61_2201 [Micrococcaceae bacterium]|jgi:uncharacterized membrane protein YkvA (DUF1232 family)|uniref:DUF1232 domain-containing protein n=1 Tax=Arthrobacter cheniae TaxID=1258888 RepID=A0A3A5LYM2_9MICC|nr:DUF1232 domain-containing protein [Arthrobacter cheniae]MCU1633549.1 hypothetical protein [Micrococcaceae bacterium]RJT77341.1 DUF1232 domain-containing protein [Arthrobacter cheniae]